MGSKKGIVLTIGILVAIAAGSSIFWLVPQQNPMTIVVTDFENHLDGIKAKHNIIASGLEVPFSQMLNGEISSQEYINIAMISTSQVNALIIEMVDSGAPDNWQESYLNYLESLRSFNTYIRETIVVANMIQDGADINSVDNTLNQITKLKQDSESLSDTSDNSRP
ncbi:MAG: hypothetical protein VX209_03895 [Thermoproteota archaeon]|nr:hypothetical protein [Thermoproteota archaeon]